VAERIGSGRMVSGGDEPAVGRFVALLDVESLMRAMDDGREPLVAYLAHPNVTMMAPIHSRLAAIVCASGDESAHVAIVARELGLPCAVQFQLDRKLEDLERLGVRLDPDGTLLLEG
jgi:signal transduction protein with GAF and PtsI domain